MAADIDTLVSFEEEHYDEYEYYNLMEYPCHAGGKGRTKREIGLNTNRHCPAGHERNRGKTDCVQTPRGTQQEQTWWLHAFGRFLL
ncbi:nuclear transcriptional regulator 1-like protein [Arapaima gigas]